MKKVLFIMALVLLCIPAVHADKVSSTSRSIMTIKEEHNYKSNFLVKLGGGVVNRPSLDKFAYNATLGYQKQFSTLGLYWGGQLGVQNTIDSESDGNAIGAYLMPTFGLSRAFVTRNSSGLDAHVGLGYLANGNQNLKWEVGLGLWFNKYLVEIQYFGYADDSYTFQGVLLNFGLRF